MITKDLKSILPIWTISILEEHPYFYEISSISLKNTWKNFPQESWYAHWNMIFFGKDSPYHIKSWKYSVIDNIINWEIRMKFTKVEDQNNVTYYKQFIQLLPLWWYFFFLHSDFIQLSPDFPYKQRETIIKGLENEKTYYFKRSMISFLKVLFKLCKITLTLQYQFSARKGWGTIKTNSDYSLQEYLEDKWGDFESDLTYPYDLLTKDHIINEWRKLPEVKFAVQRLKEEIVDSSEGQLLQQLLLRNPELKVSFQKALAMQNRRLKAAKQSRDQIFTGTVEIFKPN